MRRSIGQRLFRLGLDCDRLLEMRLVRALLSLAILTSLLPVPAIQRVEPWFFLLFAVELGLRALAVAATSRPIRQAVIGVEVVEPTRHRSLASAYGMLVFDAVALASFLPLPVGVEGARWLRVVRLLRLLALVGYWRRLLVDMWSILARRERLRQVALLGVIVGGISFAGAVVLHHVDDVPFDADDDGDVDEADRGFWLLLWWSFRQVQDPGNMLEAPNALPTVLVSVGLTVFGLLLVSFLIGLGSDVVHELVEHARMRPPGFADHTVIVNMVPSVQRLLFEVVAYYRKLFPTDAAPLSWRWWSDLRRRGIIRPRFVVIGEGLHAPDFLRHPAMSRVAYRARPEDEEELIARADLIEAKRVLLLADVSRPHADAQTIRMLLTLVERVRSAERDGRISRAGRTRLVIAEILDDSNIAAAHAALATAGNCFRGWVLPTEKLLGLFFAGVIRRPGLGNLLAILLTSVGHELYTCFFGVPGLGFQVARPEGVGGPAGPLMRRLADLGQQVGGVQGPVIPLGVLLDREGVDGAIDVVINPAADLVLDESRVRGFVGVAADFLTMRRWIDAWSSPPTASAPIVDAPTPKLARTRRPKTTRMLVCGFRPGTLYMIEELFRSDPSGEILVLVDDTAARDAALAVLETHTQLVRRRLLPGRHGVFQPNDDGELTFALPQTPGRLGRLRIDVADSMAKRHLVDLPGGFGHVADLDAVTFVAGSSESSDARITTTLLVLEELCRSGPDARRPAIVAEVHDTALAARLGARARLLGHAHVQVFSQQELRAFFLFQTVVVPGFDAVYEELLGAWGQSLVHLDVVERDGGSVSFVALAQRLRADGMLLVAVEVDDGRGGTKLCVAPGADEPGGVLATASLRGAWVVAPDSGGPDPYGPYPYGPYSDASASRDPSSSRHT
jgi:hypothetical protein